MIKAKVDELALVLAAEISVSLREIGLRLSCHALWKL
jgi:hypothetical protein